MKALTTTLILVLLALLVIAAPLPHAAAQNPITPTDYRGAWEGYLLVTFKESPYWSGGPNEAIEKALQESFASLAPEHTAWPPYELQIGPWSLDRTKVIVEARFDNAPRKDMIVDLLTARLKASKMLIDSGIDVLIFGEGGTWKESHNAVTQYLADNIQEWQLPDESDTVIK